MTRMAGNRDTTWLGWVLVLSVTTSRGDQIPTVVLNQFDSLTNLHCHRPALFILCSGDDHYSHQWGEYTTNQAQLQEVLRLYVIPQHQLSGIRMQVHLLVHPIWHRIAVQVMLHQRQWHDQRHQTLPVVLNEAQQLQPTASRPCLRSTGGS